jgi:general secretion pathway protein D
MGEQLTRAVLVATVLGAIAGCAERHGRWAEPPQPLAAEPAVPPSERPPPIARPIELGLPSQRDEEAEPLEPVVQRGTGSFVAPPGPAVRASLTTDAAGEITLNVVDAELREVVRLVLQDALGVNYVIDPAVGGRITVQTMRPLPADDLVAVLDAVLRMNGAALVRAGDLYKVVPIDQAVTSGPVPDVGPVPDAGDPGFGVRVVPLRFVAANELAPVLAPFAPPGGAIEVDPARNLLLLAGLPDQLATLTNLVSIFDVDWLQGMSFGLFPLDNAPAAELVAELQEIFSNLEGGPLAGLVRFVPIERLNAVLVVSSQPGYLTEAETWIDRLDRVGEGEEPRIFVYSVQNARATSLAEVLSEMFGARTTTVEGASLLAPGEEAVELSTTSAFDPDAAETETTEEGDVELPLRAGPPPGEPLTAEPIGPEDAEIRIIADDTTNALVIRATPREYEKIREALDELDILPLQVLIEATIAEVTLTDELRYGVEWFFRSGDFEFSFTPSATALLPVGGFQGIFDSGNDVRLVLQALDAITDVNVVSSPQLMVLDNQTARIQVGDQVPISVQSATSVIDPDSPVVNSIEYRDTGVILLVTPRVNQSGLVIMEIQQEISNVVDAPTTTISEEASPTINQRQINSTVAILSGETVALGGLIQDQRERAQSGIPFLSRLPIVGALFRTRANNVTRTELLVLITPSVVENPARARAVTDELRRRLRSLEQLESRVR